MVNLLPGNRKTKIVATIGPVSSSPEMLRQLMLAGMDVARLNFSHGDHEGHGETIRRLRQVSSELGREIGILQDLGGPKIRLGRIDEPERLLTAGGTVSLVPADHAPAPDLPVNYDRLVDDVEIGHRILLADGQVELEVRGKEAGRLLCNILVGGTVSSHKGVNLPSSELSIPAMTDKDRLDLEFGLSQGVDFVALSFVRHENDLAPLRKMVSTIDRPPLLIAKIEKPQALDRLKEILGVVEGVMVARGDLGVEMPLAEVPLIQKRVIKEARRAGRAVITATQMLRSMMNSPHPSRAEVTDVANAVLDGTDAVMLSDESAVGHYPVESVRVLHQVCQVTDPHVDAMRYLREDLSDLLPMTEAAISRAACWLASDLDTAAIMAATTSGSTARLIARYRPPQPVIGMTWEERTFRQLSLSWGVIPALIPPCTDTEDVVDQARRWVREKGLAGPGDRLILSSGLPLHMPGTTNMLKVVDMTERRTESEP
ncbi:MAG: pyruvate kinase [Proteobacteria bacterium]|nr:pyruvate kinase [Pseudomonadota bacterium]